MREDDKHHHGHGHGDEGHWGERPERPHHRHGGECGGGHGEHPRHGGECCGGRGGHHHYGGECCRGGEGKAWGPGSPFRRHFPTREEQIAWLEDYLKELQAEAKGVEERIAEMKANG
jgi:hypothetical protein